MKQEENEQVKMGEWRKVDHDEQETFLFLTLLVKLAEFLQEKANIGKLNQSSQASQAFEWKPIELERVQLVQLD